MNDDPRLLYCTRAGRHLNPIRPTSCYNLNPRVQDVDRAEPLKRISWSPWEPWDLMVSTRIR